jgi:hypothetical protein
MSLVGYLAMSLNLLLHALAHAGVVLVVAAITRSRGWTFVAAVAAALLAFTWGHSADVAEKWVVIGVGYWTCWRMLPRQKFPRSARPRKTSRSKIRRPTFTGLKGGLLTAALVVVVSVVTGLSSQPTKRSIHVPEVAIPRFSSDPSTTVKQQPMRAPALSLL